MSLGVLTFLQASEGPAGDDGLKEAGLTGCLRLCPLMTPTGDPDLQWILLVSHNVLNILSPHF